MNNVCTANENLCTFYKITEKQLRHAQGQLQSPAVGPTVMYIPFQLGSSSIYLAKML